MDPSGHRKFYEIDEAANTGVERWAMAVTVDLISEYSGPPLIVDK